MSHSAVVDTLGYWCSLKVEPISLNAEHIGPVVFRSGEIIALRSI
jgi:hypothetical protein